MKKDLRVVSILSPYKLVINAGENAGIKKNQIIVIYGIGTESIKDIETGEELEKLEILRGRGKVIHVQEKICTVESVEVGNGGKRVIKSFKGFQSILNPTEEIIYDDDVLPFEEPQIGDYARVERA